MRKHRHRNLHSISGIHGINSKFCFTNNQAFLTTNTWHTCTSAQARENALTQKERAETHLESSTLTFGVTGFKEKILSQRNSRPWCFCSTLCPSLRSPSLFLPDSTAGSFTFILYVIQRSPSSFKSTFRFSNQWVWAQTVMHLICHCRIPVGQILFP